MFHGVRRVISGLLCLTLLAVGLTACGDVHSDEVSDTDAKNITYAYSEITASGIQGDPERVLRYNGKVYVLAVDSQEDNPVSRVYQLDDTYRKAELVTELNLEQNRVTVGEIIQIDDDTICYWTLDASNKKKIVVTDWSGVVQKQVDLMEYIAQDENIRHVCQSKKGNYAIDTEAQMLLVDAEGKKLAKVDTKGNVCGCAITSEGDLVLAVNEERGVVGYIVNERDGSLSSSMLLDTNLVSGATDNALCDGDENYDYYLHGQSRLYGYDRKKKASVPLLDYTTSAMEMTEAWDVIPVAKGRMLGVYYNENEGTKLSAYRKIDPDKVQNKQKITIGGLWLDSNSMIVDRVAAFNKSNPEYKMEIKSYSSDDAIEKFNLDIASGKIPDILVLEEWSPVNEYIAKGMLENLYEYFDQDEEVNKEDMLDSLRKAMEVDGKLYYLSDMYDISTWVVPTDYVGDKIGWTMEECMDFVKQYPDASLFESTKKDCVLYSLTFNNLVDFVDWEKGECYFDNEEFIDMLKLANERGTDTEQNEDMDEVDRAEAYQNREILFQTSNWEGINMIESAKHIYGTDSVTMIGRPNREKNGSCFVFQDVFGISSQSKVKDGAWKFIRELLLRDSTVRKDDFQEQMDWYLDSDREKDEGGENEDGSWTYASPTEEEVQQYIDLINRTNKVEWKDNNIYNIVEEEAQACFAGQRSEEETAKIIQARVTTYMNEKK